MICEMRNWMEKQISRVCALSSDPASETDILDFTFILLGFVVIFCVGGLFVFPARAFLRVTRVLWVPIGRLLTRKKFYCGRREKKKWNNKTDGWDVCPRW